MNQEKTVTKEYLNAAIKRAYRRGLCDASGGIKSPHYDPGPKIYYPLKVEVVNEFFENKNHNGLATSINSFLMTGKVSGSFAMALYDIMETYEGRKADLNPIESI